MNELATSSLATTTCSYFYEGVDTKIASTSCTTLTSSATSTPNLLSTDPVLDVLVAALLMLYAATYVRRVFFS